MAFVDEVRVWAQAGDGGRGCVSFLREKHRPWGGPSGGDGGRGGDVVLLASRHVGTLLELKHHPHLRAERGGHGRGKNQHGRCGQDLVVCVPLGTVVRDGETGEVLADLKVEGERVVVAAGGKGGRGNAFFASPKNRAPRFCEPGSEGERRPLVLELRLLAEVGLVGLPNAGKSTLLAAVSAARPRIADFPFTTLAPHLGIVRLDDDRSFVMADLPGLIRGAHRGEGLGSRFLRHASRTAVLVHLLDGSVGAEEGRDPVDDYRAVREELERFGQGLAAKPEIVAVTKMDLEVARCRLPAIRRALAAEGLRPLAVSAKSGEGMAELVAEIDRLLRAVSPEGAAREAGSAFC
jgi:GTP-binding protein